MENVFITIMECGDVSPLWMVEIAGHGLFPIQTEISRKTSKAATRRRTPYKNVAVSRLRPRRPMCYSVANHLEKEAGLPKVTGVAWVAGQRFQKRESK